jgi:hypothetical protein
MQAAPAARFILFVVVANGRFTVEAQKLLIDLSCAITRMGARCEKKVPKLLSWRQAKRSTSGCVSIL